MIQVLSLGHLLLSRGTPSPWNVEYLLLFRRPPGGGSRHPSFWPPLSSARCLGDLDPTNTEPFLMLCLREDDGFPRDRYSLFSSPSRFRSILLPAYCRISLAFLTSTARDMFKLNFVKKSKTVLYWKDPITATEDLQSCSFNLSCVDNKRTKLNKLYKFDCNNVKLASIEFFVDIYGKHRYLRILNYKRLCPCVCLSVSHLTILHDPTLLLVIRIKHLNTPVSAATLN
mgnify:CR=1 FL=1